MSIHHNAEPDGPSDGPGERDLLPDRQPRTRSVSPGCSGRRSTAAFAPYHLAWVADTDHGAKYRPNASGGDYYGILRRAAGVTTVLSEAAFISNPPEEHVLARPAFQHVEAQAIADAIVRFVTTDAPGAGS